MVPSPVFETAHLNYVMCSMVKGGGGLGLELCLLTLNSVCPLLLILFFVLTGQRIKVRSEFDPSPVLSLRSVVSVYICVFVCTRHEDINSLLGSCEVLCNTGPMANCLRTVSFLYLTSH